MSPARPRWFAIVATMRTGSNLLERNLNQFPDLLCHGELFNPAFIGGEGRQEFHGLDRAARDRDPGAFLDRIVAAAGERVPGFRIFEDHDARILDRVAKDPACARVVLTRDPLDSFVSLAIARETGQWLLGSVTRRRSAIVHFDAPAFEEHRERLAGFHAGFARRMQEAGQTAFTLDYRDLGALSVLNGLAAHLGSRHRLDRIAETIVRQNPGPIADKVANPEALAPYLAGRMSGPGGGACGPGEPAWRSFVLAPRSGLLFAPIPGGPERAALRWLASIEGSTGALRKGLGREEVLAFLASGACRAAFTATRDPLARAHRVFVERILVPGPQAFPGIRARLAESFGLALPAPEAAAGGDRATLERAGYGAGAHGAAFAGFLRFLAENLAGRTAVRTDPLWSPQTGHLAALGAALPLRLVMAEEWLAKGGNFLRSVLGIAEGRNALLREPDPEGPFPLAEIVTGEHVGLARAAYAADCALLGGAVPGGPQAA